VGVPPLPVLIVTVPLMALGFSRLLIFMFDTMLDTEMGSKVALASPGSPIAAPTTVADKNRLFKAGENRLRRRFFSSLHERNLAMLILPKKSVLPLRRKTVAALAMMNGHFGAALTSNKRSRRSHYGFLCPNIDYLHQLMIFGNRS
jgi:hypothetical protein